MSKRNRRNQKDQTSSDGGIALDEVSPDLQGAAGGHTETEERQLHLRLTRVNEAALRVVQIGQAVTFETQDPGLAVLRGSLLVGFVAQSKAAEVSRLVRTEAVQAWISDVFDRGVQVTISW